MNALLLETTLLNFSFGNINYAFTVGYWFIEINWMQLFHDNK